MSFRFPEKGDKWRRRFDEKTVTVTFVKRFGNDQGGRVCFSVDHCIRLNLEYSVQEFVELYEFLRTGSEAEPETADVTDGADVAARSARQPGEDG